MLSVYVPKTNVFGPRAISTPRQARRYRKYYQRVFEELRNMLFFSMFTARVQRLFSVYVDNLKQLKIIFIQRRDNHNIKRTLVKNKILLVD